MTVIDIESENSFMTRNNTEYEMTRPLCWRTLLESDYITAEQFDQFVIKADNEFDNHDEINHVTFIDHQELITLQHFWDLKYGANSTLAQSTTCYKMFSFNRILQCTHDLTNPGPSHPAHPLPYHKTQILFNHRRFTTTEI
jgi:hypothetical protein